MALNQRNFMKRKLLQSMQVLSHKFYRLQSKIKKIVNKGQSKKLMPMIRSDSNKRGSHRPPEQA